MIEKAIITNAPNRIINHSEIWRKWTLSYSLATFIGFMTATIIAILHRALFGIPVLFHEYLINFLFMAVAGLASGITIAYFQWRVIRHLFPDLSKTRWIFLTSFGVLTIWLLGILPGISMNQLFSTDALVGSKPPWWMILLIGSSVGLCLGAIWGWAQNLELKKHIASQPSKWIITNSLAWMVGLPIVMVGANIPVTTTGWPSIVLVGTLSWLLSSFSVGIITGWFLSKLTKNIYKSREQNN